MGNTLNQWRAAVGGFCQPVKCKTRFKTLQIRYHCFMSLGLRTLLLVLLVAQGVEPNPGPPGRSFADGVIVGPLVELGPREVEARATISPLIIQTRRGVIPGEVVVREESCVALRGYKTDRHQKNLHY